MNYKIICESASNVYKLKNVPYECISATIDTCVSRYNDDRGLDISLMMDQIATCPSEIEISTPSVKQWFDTFKADVNFALCNTSLLSSSYNNAILAKHKFEALNPNKKVFVINTNTTGPALQLVIEKLYNLLQVETDFEEVFKKIQEYVQNVHVFITSIKPSAHAYKNVFTTFNSVLNTIGLPLVSTLRKQRLCTSNAHMLRSIVHNIKKEGFSGNRIILAHHQNEESIVTLKNMLYKTFGPIQIDVTSNSGINTYYFGKEAILVGYEK